MTAQLAPEPHLSGKALARARLRARRQKSRRIRHTVVAFALATFIAAWLGIYVQMVSGKDPALSASRPHSASQVAKASTTVVTSSAPTGSTSSGGTTGSDSQVSPSPSPVTTSQS